MTAESNTRFVDGSGRRKRKICPPITEEPGGIAQLAGFVADASLKPAPSGTAS
jgi:hypothetical protein